MIGNEGNLLVIDQNIEFLVHLTLITREPIVISRSYLTACLRMPYRTSDQECPLTGKRQRETVISDGIQPLNNYR